MVYSMHDLYLQRVCLYFLQEHSLAYKVKKSTKVGTKYSIESKQKDWHYIKNKHDNNIQEIQSEAPNGFGLFNKVTNE